MVGFDSSNGSGRSRTVLNGTERYQTLLNGIACSYLCRCGGNSRSPHAINLDLLQGPLNTAPIRCARIRRERQQLAPAVKQDSQNFIVRYATFRINLSVELNFSLRYIRAFEILTLDIGQVNKIK